MLDPKEVAEILPENLKDFAETASRLVEGREWWDLGERIVELFGNEEMAGRRKAFFEAVAAKNSIHLDEFKLADLILATEKEIEDVEKLTKIIGVKTDESDTNFGIADERYNKCFRRKKAG